MVGRLNTSDCTVTLNFFTVLPLLAFSFTSARAVIALPFTQKSFANVADLSSLYASERISFASSIKTFVKVNCDMVLDLRR